MLRNDSKEATIINAVCKAMNVSYNDLTRECRLKELGAARAMAVFFLNRDTDLSFKQIARLLKRDQATILSRYRRTKDLIGALDGPTIEALRKVSNELDGTTGPEAEDSLNELNELENELLIKLNTERLTDYGQARYLKELYSLLKRKELLYKRLIKQIK